MRAVIALHSRNVLLPRWLQGFCVAAFLLWFGLLGLCLAILLSAVVSIALGV